MKSIKLSSPKKGTVAVQKYVQATKGKHVVPSDSGWKVKNSGSQRASKICVTKQEAIEYAKKIAKNQKAELFIHGRDGCIQERNSYGNDTFPPRG